MCEQPLSEEARERLGRFENFVRDTVSQKLAAAENLWAKLAASSEDTDVAATSEAGLIDELKVDDPALADQIEDSFSRTRHEEESPPHISRNT